MAKTLNTIKHKLLEQTDKIMHSGAIQQWYYGAAKEGTLIA